MPTGAQGQTARGMAGSSGNEPITLELTSKFPAIGCSYARRGASFSDTFQVEDARDSEIVLRMPAGPATDAGH
jgi:hypothetical protein